MAKKIYSEKQQFRAWDVLFLLGFLITGLTYRFIEQNFWNQTEASLTWGIYLLLVVSMGFVLFYLWTLRMDVQMTDKHVKVQYFGWNTEKVKIKWKDVANCEVVNTGLISQLNGYNIHFGSENYYSLCGRNGLLLTLKDDGQVFVGCRNTEELKVVLEEVWKGKEEEVGAVKG